MIKVMLVDDQQLFREGVEALISNTNDIEVISMADSGEQAITLLETEKPDVVLMDIHMPQMDGIKTTAYIKETHSNMKVVMLTSINEEELVIRAIKVGADGFLLKDLYPEKLTESIRDVMKGQNVLSGEVAGLLVDRIRELTLDKKEILGRRLDNQGVRLTNRELDIAYFILNGHSNQAIAKYLFLGQGTVKNYISEIYSKLDIHNRKQAETYFSDLLK